jgi:hypothetical protein
VRACTVEGCDRQHAAKGFCQKHYKRMRYQNPDLEVRPMGRVGCEVEGCEGKHYSLGLCKNHYQMRWSKGSTERTLPVRPEVCEVPGCASKHLALGLCRKHYDIKRRWNADLRDDAQLRYALEILEARGIIYGSKGLDRKGKG